jgi:ATP-dependent Lon protease
MTPLSKKLNEVFSGRVVRKDLVQRVKKGTNVPTFVLEFLLARYCATDDPDEIEAGLLAVNEAVQGNFVRPNESNAAQSLVQQKGSHKFIDKVRVVHKEAEKRHWGEMENFGSKRIAINDRHYKENKRLLEGGLWCEAVVAYNPVEDDDYTFFFEELRPIQISRFDFDVFVEGRKQFTRDEWLDALLCSIGLEPSKMSHRLKFHHLARLVPFVESNYNLIELGPRGTGKSYVFAEFSPYATLISGGQTSTAILFYNKVRRQVGIIGYWDVIAFDEVAGIRIKDPGTIQILKDYMANGRFSLGTEVIAPASLGFVGNIDDAISDLVASNKYDLFKPLPAEFDLAVIHRFHNYIPGWEIPPNSNDQLTSEYGFITDYLAEAFHYLAKNKNHFTPVKKRARLGPGFQGRDETAVYKTVGAFIKLLHPSGECSDAEFEEYLAYAIEGRRRIKEQLNKRKPDDEFADIDLSYINNSGQRIMVLCPETKGVSVDRQRPKSPAPGEPTIPTPVLPAVDKPVVEVAGGETSGSLSVAKSAPLTLAEKHFTIRYGDIGYSYGSLFGDYLTGAKVLTIEDPYIRRDYQIRNLIQVCELAVQTGTIKKITLVTATDHDYQKAEVEPKFQSLTESLADSGVEFSYRFDDKIHDRELRTDTGWNIRIGRGLDIYQRTDSWIQIGASNLDLRPCMETKVSIFRQDAASNG